MKLFLPGCMSVRLFFDKSVVKYQIFRSILLNQPIMGVNEDTITGSVEISFPVFMSLVSAIRME